MKRRIGFFCLALALLLSGCGGTAVTVPDNPPLPASAGLRVAVATDLHLDPDHTDKSGTPAAAAYNLELVDALLWDARQQGAEILLLTGDLVNGGKVHRHEALAEKLRAAEETGLAVFVVPGNHDLSPIGQQEFARLYADFGYGEASSRDPASLSYSVLRQDVMLLMLDTGGYPGGAIDLPAASGRRDGEACLSSATLGWIREQLKAAQAEGLPVLCAGHFNLLPAESRDSEKSGYYLENGEALAMLLRSCGVPLYLSGHLHVRAVLEEDGLTELITEYLLAYPAGYTVLDLEGGRVTARHRRVDVDGWAKASGQTDPVLLDFAMWQQKALYAYSRENVAYMSERNRLSPRQQRQAAAFFYAVMDAFWRGELHNKREALEAMPGCAPFFRCAEGYAYGWWLKDLMENASPKFSGFTLG